MRRPTLSVLGPAPVCSADAHFRASPPDPGDDDLDDFRRQQQEADLVHRLLALISYAAHTRNSDLTDLPELADAIFDLHNDSQQATRIRR